MKEIVRVFAVLLVVGCSVGNSDRSLKRNKELVHRAHTDVWSRGDMKAADEIYEDDFVAHWLGGAKSQGREKFKALVADTRRRAPDLKETVDQTVAEGDLVVTRFTSRGTFASEPGEPSKFKEATMHEIAIHRIRDGKIVEQWTVGSVPAIRHLSHPAASGKNPVEPESKPR